MNVGVSTVTKYTLTDVTDAELLVLRKALDGEELSIDESNIAEELARTIRAVNH